jgi:hypothetical protein
MKPEKNFLPNSQVIDKTGRPLEHWRSVLDAFGAGKKSVAEVAAHLQTEHVVQRHWARTIAAWYSKLP